MRPAGVRRALHHGHAATSIALIATGWLIGDADLRGRLLGGFGRELLDAHLGLGVAFGVVPALALAAAPRFLLRDLRLRLGPPGPRWAWRKVHLVGSLALAMALGASGVGLWLDLGLETRALDRLLEIHVACTWILALSVPVHLVAVRRRLAARLGWGDAPDDPAGLHVDADGRPVE